MRREEPETRARRKARRYGMWTEFLAATALRLKGYRILARNYRTRAGEIDIIARKGDLVAIVEVKARKTLAASLDAVDHTGSQRIEAAADWWLASRRDADKLSMRFDIISVQPWSWPVHVEDAF